MFPAAEKVSSLGKDWHKFCLKCERCNKTLTPGGHAEVRAPGVDAVGKLCCRAGMAWWALQGSSAPQGWGVPGIGLGHVPSAMRRGCSCGTQAQERTLWWLQMLLLVLKSSRAQCWASHRAVLATHVVPQQLCHPSVGSQAAWKGSACPGKHVQQPHALSRLVWASLWLRRHAGADSLHQSVDKTTKNRGCGGCHGNASSAPVLSVMPPWLRRLGA